MQHKHKKNERVRSSCAYVAGVLTCFSGVCASASASAYAYVLVKTRLYIIIIIIIMFLFQGGNLSQLSPTMNTVVQPSKPYTSQTPSVATSTAPRPNNTISGINDSRVPYRAVSSPGISPINPPPYPTGHQNTFLTPVPSVQAYPPQYSLPPGMSPPWVDAYPQRHRGDFRGASPNTSVTPLAGPFSPKTTAELGLLDRPDTSYEGLELSNIVDRMTASFPLDVHSGI